MEEFLDYSEPQVNMALNEEQPIMPVKKSRKWLLPAIIAGGVLLLLAILAFFLFRSPSSKVDYSLIPVQDNSGKWGYINQKGTYVINPQFPDCSLFSDGLAKVETSNGKVGYIDKKGKFVIPATYMNGTDFHDGLAFVVTEGGRPECIDTKGKKIFTLMDATSVRGYSEGLACFCSNNGKFGFIDKKGKAVIPAQFEDAEDFHEGLAAIYQNDKIGYIDKKGHIVITAQFEDADNFREGLAAFMNGDMVGFVDKKGKYAINPQFDIAQGFSDGLAAFRNDDMVGFINKKGNIVINPQFEDAHGFSEGMAAVSNGDKVGFINKKGQYVINPQFEEAGPFIGKVAPVCSAGKWGLINKDGSFVVNPMFADILTPDDFENETIRSDYYDATPFINAFFKNFSEKNFDGFYKGATLADIIDHPVYGDLADTYGTRRVVCKFEDEKEIANNISLEDVEFYFNDEIYTLDYDHYNYESGYEKNYNMSEPIGYINYEFNLSAEAAEKSGALHKALRSKLSSLYGIHFTEKKMDGQNLSYGSGSNFSFAIAENYGGIILLVFLDKETYDNVIGELDE